MVLLIGPGLAPKSVYTCQLCSTTDVCVTVFWLLLGSIGRVLPGLSVCGLKVGAFLGISHAYIEELVYKSFLSVRDPRNQLIFVKDWTLSTNCYHHHTEPTFTHSHAYGDGLSRHTLPRVHCTHVKAFDFFCRIRMQCCTHMQYEL